MLKHCLLTLMLAGLVYAVAPFAVAQNAGSQQSAPASAPERGGRHHHFDPAKRTEMLTKKLNLTSDQQSKVQDLLKSEQSQMQNLRADTSLSRDDRRSKMMEIHKTSDDQIRGLLDPNQQKKWDAMQEKRKQRMEQHKKGAGVQPGSETK